MGRALRLNDSLTWEDVRVLRELWPRKLVLKGMLHPQDVVTAAHYGVDAVVVSNHGGRTVDGAVAPIEVLPKIVDAVGGRMTVIVDSGFRRGSDVVKALALGAKAVLIGRSTLYGVAADGEAGAARAIAIFREEIDRVLALIGCRSIARLSRDYLAPPEEMHEQAAGGAQGGLRLVDSAKTAIEM
jgi:isopentenyl diphosphate isomerase/L-lactate dehydrogenase-like FMN-dependent dehydrogenase